LLHFQVLESKGIFSQPDTVEERIDQQLRRRPEPQPAAVHSRAVAELEFIAVPRAANPALLDHGFVEWTEQVWAVAGVNHEFVGVGERQDLCLSFGGSPNPSIRHSR